VQAQRQLAQQAAKHVDALPDGEVAAQVLRDLGAQLQIVYDHQAALGLVLPHGPPCLGAHLCHRELAAPFHYGQALGHWLPGLGGTAELRQVGIAALYITQIDTGTGAEQLLGQVRWSMLEGDSERTLFSQPIAGIMPAIGHISSENP
jgi:hypothetical protein